MRVTWAWWREEKGSAAEKTWEWSWKSALLSRVSSQGLAESRNAHTESIFQLNGDTNWLTALDFFRVYFQNNVTKNKRRALERWIIKRLEKYKEFFMSGKTLTIHEKDINVILMRTIRTEKITFAWTWEENRNWSVFWGRTQVENWQPLFVRNGQYSKAFIFYGSLINFGASLIFKALAVWCAHPNPIYNGIDY